MVEATHRIEQAELAVMVTDDRDFIARAFFAAKDALMLLQHPPDDLVNRWRLVAESIRRIPQRR